MMWTCHIIEAYMIKFEMFFRETILYRCENYKSPEFYFAKIHNQCHVSLRDTVWSVQVRQRGYIQMWGIKSNRLILLCKGALYVAVYRKQIIEDC